MVIVSGWKLTNGVLQKCLQGGQGARPVRPSPGPLRQPQRGLLAAPGAKKRISPRGPGKRIFATPCLRLVLSARGRGEQVMGDEPFLAPAEAPEFGAGQEKQAPALQPAVFLADAIGLLEDGQDCLGMGVQVG